MKIPGLVAVLGLAATAAAAAAANCTAHRLSVQAADTFVSRGYAQGLKDGSAFVTYEDGVAWRALEMVYDATSDVKYFNHIKKGADNLVTAAGGLLDYDLEYYTLDDLRIGESLIYLAEKTGEAKYRQAADLLRSQLQTHPRNSLGGFWHRSTYPNQMWLDGLYMASPFYAHYAAVYEQSTNSTASVNDIVTQFELTHTNCANANAGQAGLLKHGYDESRVAVWADDATGASPEVWDRALGWYVMALVDVLDFLPAGGKQAASLQSILKESAAAIKAAVDSAGGSGLWWLVMSQPGKEGNYIESSGAAMFVYALLKGIRLGYLDSGVYLEVATKAYQEIVQRFVGVGADGGVDWSGTVSVGSLKGYGDYQYYISVALNDNDLKGFGPFIMASVEYEKATC